MGASEDEIKNFWQENPVGENLTGKSEDWAKHFEQYDRYRYQTEEHILKELSGIDFKDKKVLEIGIGQAADSFQIAKSGGSWNGLDLTTAAVERARARFELGGLEYGEVKVGSATEIPWEDNTFDIVYSHGVLHHIPDIQKVSCEIERVLKSKGKLIVMLYHKNSLNYYLSIGVFRRVGLIMLYILHKLRIYTFADNSVFGGHLENLGKYGWSYLHMKNFLHHNTDGPNNPFSRVYTKGSIRRDFSRLCLDKTAIYFLNERHFPGARLLPSFLTNYLSKKFGWHLWAYMSKR